MFCPNCKCEFVGWRRCPDCEIILEESPPEVEATAGEPMAYDELLDLVRQNGGQIEIDVVVSGVNRERKLRFPYRGHGYAWARGMQGEGQGLSVRLATDQVGRKRGWSFPYLGYGYAWEKSMQGQVSGNPLELRATKVQRENKWRFPYLGYGRAWVESLAGECGQGLRAELEISEVAKKRSWTFPYHGYGFAWPKSGVLKLALNPN